MKKDKALEAHHQRLSKLAEQLGRTGLILPGSIFKRIIKKEVSDEGKPQKILGPYYQWTWKKKGKTVTINLTKEQVVEFQKAIDTQRTVEKIIKEMRDVSLQILELTTKSVKRKKIKKIEL